MKGFYLIFLIIGCYWHCGLGASSDDDSLLSKYWDSTYKNNNIKSKDKDCNSLTTISKYRDFCKDRVTECEFNKETCEKMKGDFMEYVHGKCQCCGECYGDEDSPIGNYHFLKRLKTDSDEDCQNFKTIEEHDAFCVKNANCGVPVIKGQKDCPKNGDGYLYVRMSNTKCQCCGECVPIVET